ncbi:MAG: RNA methyltransferase [Chloroflexi bacterium]|nr:RNA methyltransferase [Chloroflexota bacterium]
MKQLIGTDLKRFNRAWQRAYPHHADIVLVLQSVAYPANVGSLFRIADGVNLTEMILCSATPTPPQPTVVKVARDKHKRIAWRYEERAEEAIATLRSAGYHIAAVEITDEAIPYFDFAAPRRTAFVLGNEDHGVSQSVLDLCDTAVFVPMYGRGLSLNVHVSAGVILYDAVVQHVERND